MAGLYIHIPLCASRCYYCDFYSTTAHSQQQRIVDSLCKEMALRKDYLGRETIRTLYIGGGTPSTLSADLLSQLFESARCQFDCQLEEVTMEANPDDLSAEYIASLRSLPVNRLSIGIQSFDDEDLKRINRRHTATQAIKAVHDCQTAGFSNLSIDLIYGLPFQTMDGWKKNLQTAVGLNVQHMSAYCLTYEEGTMLYKQWQQGKVSPSSDEDNLSFFRQLRTSLLSAGYEHYEISNFSLPGFRAKHNSSCWNGTPYVGIGPSAHSFDGMSRQWNVPDIRRYMAAVEAGHLDFEREQLTCDEKYNDRIITSLRTSRGLDMEALKRDFPDYYDFCLDSAGLSLKAGQLELTDDGFLRLTESGLFISDSIFVDLIKA